MLTGPFLPLLLPEEHLPVFDNPDHDDYVGKQFTPKVEVLHKGEVLHKEEVLHTTV